MKKLKLLAMILCLAIVAVSCKKEEGPQGPAGPSGTNGTNGNANVTVYGFGAQTFTSTAPTVAIILPISGTRVDSCLILPYYHYTSWWYQFGEIGYGSAYQSRYYIYPSDSTSTLLLQIYDLDGTVYTGADLTVDSIRVFVIPANIFRSTPTGKVDYNDYQSVSSYYKPD
jgi:hypothetical protein